MLKEGIGLKNKEVIGNLKAVHGYRCLCAFTSQNTLREHLMSSRMSTKFDSVRWSRSVWTLEVAVLIGIVRK